MSSFDSPWTFIRDNGAHFLLGAGVGLIVGIPVALITSSVVLWISPAIAGLAGLTREIIQQLKANTPDFWRLDTLVDVAFWILGGLAVVWPIGVWIA